MRYQISTASDVSTSRELGPERSLTMSISGWQLCYYTDEEVGIALSLDGRLSLKNQDDQNFCEFHLCKATASVFYGKPRKSLPQTSIGFLDLGEERDSPHESGQIVVPDEDPLAIFNLLNAGHSITFHIICEDISDGFIAIKRMHFYIRGAMTR